MTEQTDALVVVVSEESGQISLVERARIVRNLDETKLARALVSHLHPEAVGGRLLRDTRPARRVAPSFRALARRARLRSRLHGESPGKRRPDRGSSRVEQTRIEPAQADDDPENERAAS